MKHIGKDESLHELIKTTINIISSKIVSINIKTRDFELIIEIDFELLYHDEEKHLKLVLLDIQEYSLYHNSSYTFYNVENYKLLKSEELYYLSFDPEESDMMKQSDDDNDVFVFGKMEGYIY